MTTEPNRQQDVLTDHTYDGIREYDNPTPSWWTWLFVASILFSIAYFFITTFTPNTLSPVGVYNAVKTKADMEAGGMTIDAATILQVARDPKLLETGREVFTKANCVSCHVADGSGNSGANLTDHKYIYVRRVEDIADVVAKGREQNGRVMPAHSALSPKEIVLVSGYVVSLRGSNKPSNYTLAVGTAEVEIEPFSE